MNSISFSKKPFWCSHHLSPTNFSKFFLIIFAFIWALLNSPLRNLSEVQIWKTANAIELHKKVQSTPAEQLLNPVQQSFSSRW